MITISDKVIRKQSDKLAEKLDLPPNTFFELSELQALEEADINTEIIFRGKPIRISPSIKAMSHILRVKIQKSD